MDNDIYGEYAGGWRMLAAAIVHKAEEDVAKGDKLKVERNVMDARKFLASDWGQDLRDFALSKCYRQPMRASNRTNNNRFNNSHRICSGDSNRGNE